MAEFTLFVGVDDDTPAEQLTKFIGERYQVSDIPYIQYFQNAPCRQLATRLSTFYGLPAKEEARIKDLDSAEGDAFFSIVWELWARKGICVLQRNTLRKMNTAIGRTDLCIAIRLTADEDFFVTSEQEFQEYCNQATLRGDDCGPNSYVKETRVPDPVVDRNLLVATLSPPDIVRGVTGNQAFGQKVTECVETYRMKTRERIEKLHQTVQEHLTSAQQTLSQRSQTHISALQGTIKQAEELTIALQSAKTATSQLDGNPLAQYTTNISEMSTRLQAVLKRLGEKSLEFNQLKQSKRSSLPVIIKDIATENSQMKFLVVNLKPCPIHQAYFWLEIDGLEASQIEIEGGVKPGLQVLTFVLDTDRNSAKATICRWDDKTSRFFPVSNEFPWDFAAPETLPEKPARSLPSNEGSQSGGRFNAPLFMQKGGPRVSDQMRPFGSEQEAGYPYGAQESSFPVSQYHNPISGPAFPQQFEAGQSQSPGGGSNAPAFLLGNRAAEERTLPTSQARAAESGYGQMAQPYQGQIDQYSNPSQDQYQSADPQNPYQEVAQADDSNLGAGYPNFDGAMSGNGGSDSAVHGSHYGIPPEVQAYQNPQLSLGRVYGLSPDESLIFKHIKSQYSTFSDDYLMSVVNWIKTQEGTLTFDAVAQILNNPQ